MIRRHNWRNSCEYWHQIYPYRAMLCIGTFIIIISLSHHCWRMASTAVSTQLCQDRLSSSYFQPSLQSRLSIFSLVSSCSFATSWVPFSCYFGPSFVFHSCHVSSPSAFQVSYCFEDVFHLGSFSDGFILDLVFQADV